MLKTIKTTKHMRLDELIKYVWEHDGSLFKRCMTIYFHTKDNKIVTFEESGECSSVDWFDPDDLFTVEIEEEITEDTEFELLVGVYFYDDDGSYNASTFHNRSIDDVKDSEALCVYALINDKLELIWERDDHGSN